MSSVEKLLSDIEAFLKKNDLSVSKFGTMAVNDHRFVPRLRDGGGLMLETADKIRDFMANYKPPKKTKVSNLQQSAA